VFQAFLDELVDPEVDPKGRDVSPECWVDTLVQASDPFFPHDILYDISVLWRNPFISLSSNFEEIERKDD